MTTTDMKLVGFEENYATAERRLHEALNAVHWLMVSSPKNKDKQKFEHLSHAAGLLQESQSLLIKGRE